MSSLSGNTSHWTGLSIFAGNGGDGVPRQGDDWWAGQDGWIYRRPTTGSRLLTNKAHRFRLKLGSQTGLAVVATLDVCGKVDYKDAVKLVHVVLLCLWHIHPHNHRYKKRETYTGKAASDCKYTIYNIPVCYIHKLCPKSFYNTKLYLEKHRCKYRLHIGFFGILVLDLVARRLSINQNAVIKLEAMWSLTRTYSLLVVSSYTRDEQICTSSS